MSRRPGRRGFTIAETMVVLILTGLMIAAGSAAVRHRGRDGAEARLRMIWSAEKRFYVYHNGYTADWQQLQLSDPSLLDRRFRYTIEAPNPSRSFRAAAISRTGGQAYTIDASGVVTPGS